MPANGSKREEAQVFGNLDQPNAQDVSIANLNTFRGWVLVSDGTAIKCVEVLCEGKVIGVCEHGLQRDDVVAAHSHREDAKYSGFSGNIYVPEKSLAPLQLVVSDILGRRHPFVTLGDHVPSPVLREILFTSSTAFARYIYPDINTKLHPKCEMYEFARAGFQSDLKAAEYYFSSAEFLIRNLRKFFDEADVDLKEKSVLDFASGYGRLARYFVKMFDRVTTSDVEQDMLDFNKREFGAEGFLSPESAAMLRKHGFRYDVVFGFSLFTHLSRNPWEEWFKNLFELVADGGYLIISTHGHKLFQNIFPSLAREMEDKKMDFYFIKANETISRLDENSYGTTVITDEFIHLEARLGVQLIDARQLSQMNLSPR